MALDARQSFKVGFLSRCVEAGLTLDQIRGVTKIAAEKLALTGLPEKLYDTAERIGLPTLFTGGVMAPPVLGGLAGYGLAKLTGGDEASAKSIKRRELIEEYRRQAAKLRGEAQFRQGRQGMPGPRLPG